MPEQTQSATAAFAPVPPPPTARRAGPTVLGLVLALLVVVGAGAAWGLRSVASSGDGAGSPEAAAEQLVQALADEDLERAGGLVHGIEARALEVYGTELTTMLTDQLGQAAGAGGGRPDLTVSGVRFRQVAEGGDVAVVELAGGTFGANGLELGADEVNRRLAESSDGQVGAVRLVALRDEGRWRVGVLASMANAALTAAGAAPADPARLLSGPTEAGAADPRAAVEAVFDRAVHGNAAGAMARLVPDEARVLGGARAAAAAAPTRPGRDWPPEELLNGRLPGGGLRAKTLRMREEQIADGVVRVTLTATVVPQRGRPSEPSGTEELAVVVVREGDLWYPSLVFSAVDQARTP